MEFREFRQQLSHTLWDRVVLSQALLFGLWCIGVAEGHPRGGILEAGSMWCEALRGV